MPRLIPQSDDTSETYPSTEKQWDLLNLLLAELKDLGINDAAVDEFGYVTGTLPANIPSDHPAYGKVPTIGFLAHVDTSPESPGANVNPQIIENYQGGDLVLQLTQVRLSKNPRTRVLLNAMVILSLLQTAQLSSELMTKQVSLQL
jgi:di/tripeptidase